MDEQNIPIDIHLGKLVEWLVSRRHVKREWPEEVQAVRAKINAAIQDMPEHPEVTRLLSGTYINYFHCLKIVEILKETEKDSKNILGWYGSQRMKDWLEVIKMYERDNIYIAEAAQLLVRSVNFEISGIRRQISKGSQVQQECDNKDKEFVKGIAESKKKYLSLCKQIGIAGDNVRQELLDTLKALPDEFEVIATAAKSLGPARLLYADFLTFTLTGSHPECLPLLKFIMEHGNTTTYEWLYGEAPCSIEEPQLDLEESKEEAVGGDEIDFGDGDGEIDFGEAGEPSAGDIDWGTLGTEGASQDIDWGTGEVDELATVDIEVEECGVAGGVARGPEALSLLLNPKTRGQFVDELYELVGFLGQRATELEGEGTVFSLNQFSSAPASVQNLTAELARSMVSRAEELLAKLSTTRMQHLLLISSSPRYVDRLTESLKAKLAVGEKLAAAQEAVKQRKADTAEEQRRLAPQLALIVERTRELQRHVQEDISRRYKHRPVNIMGANLSTHP